MTTKAKAKTSSPIPAVPFITRLVWDARHRMLCAATVHAKLRWAARYVKLKKLRGDYQRPEMAPD